MATKKDNAPTVRRWGYCETVSDFGSPRKGKGKPIGRRNRRRREAQAWKAEARRAAERSSTI